jgi:hypothetical protein
MTKKQHEIELDARQLTLKDQSQLRGRVACYMLPMIANGITNWDTRDGVALTCARKAYEYADAVLVARLEPPR